MNKYLKLLWRFFRICTKHSLNYKWDFLAGVVTTFIYGLTRLAFIWLLFEVGGIEKIAGFTVYQFYFIIAVTQLTVAFNFINAGPASGTFKLDIHQGRLDMNMLKPVNMAFHSSSRYIFLINALGVFLYAIILFLFTYSLVGIEWTLFNVGKLVFIIFVGVVLYAIIVWITALAWFWWPQFTAPRKLLNALFDFVKNPMELYPRPMQWFLVYIVPIFLMGNQVYLLMRGEYGWELIFRDAGILLIFGLIWALMWKAGLKKYNSAN